MQINGIDNPGIDGIVNYMNTETFPADYTANTTTVPVGLSGAQRQRYLTLNTLQRLVYRYHYDVCGRFAEHCYEYATASGAA